MEVENKFSPSKSKQKAEEEGGYVDVKRWKEKQFGETFRYQITVDSSGTYHLEKQKPSGWEFIDQDTNFRELESRAGKKAYFHGTNHEHAQKILKNGLKVQKSGSNFDQSTFNREGNATYLTTTPSRASKWAIDDNITGVVDTENGYRTQAPVVLEIDGSYIEEGKLRKDTNTGKSSDLLYLADIPAKAITTWSINPNNESEVKACADVYDRTGELNEFNKHEHPELMEEFERKCKIPF